MTNANVSHFSIKGPGSAPNQDAIIGGLEVAGGHLFAVADGVNGAPAGDVASRSALVALGLGVGIARGPDFETAFRQACKALAEKARAVPENEGMATTISAVFIKDGEAHVGHVGDSRVYRIRYGRVSHMTKDQTRAQELIDAREMSESDARHDIRHHVLRSCISAKSDFKLFAKTFGVQPGDRILLMTDGVYNVIDEHEIIEMSEGAETVDDLTEALYSAIAYLGPKDDATAVCIDVRDG